MLKRFSCHNFRNIDATNIEFERINIFIGPNNSGKSNLIKAVTFFSEMLKKANDGNFKSAFLNAVARNGWDHMLNNQADPNSVIDLSWELDINSSPVKYTLAFNVGDAVEKCNIVNEDLTSTEKHNIRYASSFNYFNCHKPNIGTGYFSTAIEKGERNKRLSFKVNSKDVLCMQFKDILLANKALYGKELIRVNIAELLYEMQGYFKEFSVYASSQFDTIKVRETANIKNIDMVLNSSASNFVNVYNNYKSYDMIWKQTFDKYLQQLIPNLQATDVSALYDKLIFKLMIGDKQYDLTDMSEGTIKGLILNMIINMPKKEKCSLLAIDEPETNLHPAWQKVIGNWLQTSDNYDQCFISTHSPDFLDVFTDEFKNNNVAVFVFDGSEQCKIKKITYADIADELGEWELGDLYRTSDPALGGWPW